MVSSEWWICQDAGIISRFGQLVGILDCPHKNLPVKLLNPKDGVRSTMLSMTNRSHQANPIIILGPCFAAVRKMKWVMTVECARKL